MAELPPIVTGMPFLGMLPDFIRDPFSYIQKVASHGDVVRVNLGGRKMFYVFHPDDLQHVLLKNHKNYTKGDMIKRLALVFGKGILLQEGEEWKSQRRRMAHSFSPGFVDAFADPIAKSASEILAGMRGERNFDEDCMELTLELVLQLLFGASAEDDTDVISESFEEISQFFASTMEYLVQIPLWVPTPGNLRFKSAFKRMEEVVTRVVQQRRTGSTEHKDLLSRLVDESDELPALDDQLIRDEVRTLMLAGHETTALALTFSAWFLSADPELQNELADELLALKGDEAICGSDLDQLGSIEAVIKEAIRILPPVPIVIRQPLEDDVLGGYHIPAGSNLILCQLRTQNDERWFPEPEKFNPRRWTPEFEQNLPRFAYFPFGGGPRVCIGMRMAMMESTLIMAELLRRYRIERTDASELSLMPSITFRPKKAVKLRLVPRAEVC